VTALDVFALVVLSVLFVVTLCLAYVLGELPGSVARRRGHPQMDAIRVAGWLGLLTLGLLWPFALIWAFTQVGSADARADMRTKESLKRLEERLSALERDAAVSAETGNREEAAP